MKGKTMFLRGGRLMPVLLATVMSVSLVGCGGGEKEPAPRVGGTSSGVSTTAGGGSLGQMLGGGAQGGDTTTQGTDVAVGKEIEYNLAYMTMWGAPVAEDSMEVMFPLGVWLKMTPESASSGKAKFNNGGGEHDMTYTLNGTDLTLTDFGGDVKAVMKDGIVVIDNPWESNTTYVFTDDTVPANVVSHIQAGGDPFSVSGSASAGGDSTDSASADDTDSTSNQKADGKARKGEFGYDMEEALKFVGDWQGILVVDENGDYEYAGEDFAGVSTFAYARIVIGEDGTPELYMRAVLPEEFNISNTVANFKEDGSMIIAGDFGKAGWWDLLLAPDPNDEYFEVWASFDEEREAFRAVFKRLGDEFTQEDVDLLPAGSMEDGDLESYNYMTQQLQGLSMQEVLAVIEESVNEGFQEKVFLLHADWLPDDDLLDLYR
ncbi:MAG: hypothetical protein IK016_07565 [Lachnospiraceae bacterium]|nr:hypothetical protein [Lachnospiraceae bacterium]